MPVIAVMPAHSLEWLDQLSATLVRMRAVLACCRAKHPALVDRIEAAIQEAELLKRMALRP